MSKAEDFFDLAAYLNEVLLSIQLRRLEASAHDLYVKFPRTEGWVNRQFDEFQAGSQGAEPDRGPNKSYDTAEKLLKRKTVLRIVCAAGPEQSDDAIDIARAITPPLVGAVFSGKIALPLEPALFAEMALIMAKMSGASPCGE